MGASREGEERRASSWVSVRDRFVMVRIGAGVLSGYLVEGHRAKECIATFV